MTSFPFLYLLLVSLSLLVVALVAQWLQVRPVKESLLTADRPRLDVVHAGGWFYYALAPTFGTKGMLGPEGPGELCPPAGVVWVGGPFPHVARRLTLAPRQVHGVSAS